MGTYSLAEQLWIFHAMAQTRLERPCGKGKSLKIIGSFLKKNEKYANDI